MLREKNTPEGRKWIKRKNNYNNVREGDVKDLVSPSDKDPTKNLKIQNSSITSNAPVFYWFKVIRNIFPCVAFQHVNVVEIITLYEEKGISGRSFVLISQIQHLTRVRRLPTTKPSEGVSLCDESEILRKQV